MHRSIPHIFRKNLIKNPNMNMLGVKKGNKWEWTNREKLNNMINYSIVVLKDRNVNKGDRVIYKGKNSVEWVSWNIATHSLGAIWVPLYSNQKEDYCRHIVNDCKPKVLISDDDIKYTDMEFISNKIENINYKNEFNITDNDLCTFIYTSGTTGNPKGVMLSHHNIISNINSLDLRFKEFKGKELTSLNILPWAHIYGLTTELYYNLFNGNKVAICSGVDNFVSECREIKPNLLYLVPKVLVLIKDKLNFLDKPILRMFLPLVLNRLFGNNILTIFMGGAKLDDNTKYFYLDNGINICEGYGCSETAPMVSVNHINFPRDIDSIGQILDNVAVNIVNNEIWVAGPNLMLGYWNDKEATNKVLVKEYGVTWYKTGDAGEQKGGFLYYKGRISENYKLTNGKFVNVNDIETQLKKYITNYFIIYGEDKPYNILIVEKPFDKKQLDEINNSLDSYLKVKRILLVESDVFADFLTPKMSIQRKKLVKSLENEINEIYK
jgi:long-chain acyl-CoA synthetase